MLFLVPPHNFSPDDRPFPRPRLSVLSSPTSPSFSFDPRKFSSSFLPNFSSQFSYFSVHSRRRWEENFVNSRKLDPSISHLSFDHFRSFYLHVSLPPFFPPIGLFLPRLYAHLALTPLRFSCTLPANFLPDLPPTSKRSIQGTPVAAKPRPLNLGLWVQRCHRILPKENISIDERGQEKAAFSASVIKPTGYKYSLSLSLSVIGNSTSISNRPLSLTWNDISRYTLGTIALNAKKGKIVMHLEYGCSYLEIFRKVFAFFTGKWIRRLLHTTYNLAIILVCALETIPAVKGLKRIRERRIVMWKKKFLFPVSNVQIRYNKIMGIYSTQIERPLSIDKYILHYVSCWWNR